MSQDFPAQHNEFACSACRKGDHGHCKRRFIAEHVDVTCVCLMGARKLHVALFREIDLLRMMGRLRANGFTVVAPGETLTIQQLLLNGSRWGLYQTIDAAKVSAQKELDEFWQTHEETPEDERDEYEPLTTRTLEWEMKHYHWKYGEDPEFPEIPVARFGEDNSMFSIIEVEVGA